MVDFGNTCALVCRFVLLILLLYGIILSSLVVSSCHFISAITHDDETHGVGLQTFENEDGTCEPHNTFVKNNYNGMEMAAKVGGYVAPTCACIVLVWLLVECCKAGGCWGGKCIPCLLLFGAVICQGITFMLFSSDLFCSNKDISRCDLGHAGYRSMQSLLVYFFCLILCYCGPTPVPFTPPEAVAKKARRGGNKDKKPKSEPGPGGGDYTKEMYEQRRKERNIKGHGVSGRKKKEIFNDLENKKSGGDSKGSKNSSSRQDDSMMSSGSFDDHEDKFGNHAITVYKPDKKKKHSREPKYDDYVDTEPDGMDWSAYTPDQRDAYYERQRSKKRERKERERRERERGSQQSGGGGSSRHRQRGGQNSDQRRGHRQEEEYSVVSYNDGGGGRGGGYNDSGTTGYEDSYEDSYRTGDSGYDVSQYSRGGGGRGGGRGGGGYNDYGNSPGSGRDSRDYSRGSVSRGTRGHHHDRDDDYSYAQDSYAYSSHQGGGGGGGGGYDDSYYSSDNHRGGGRSSRGSGSGRSSKNNRDRGGGGGYDQDSYYEESYASASYDDRGRGGGGGYRDDPSFV